MLAPMTSLQLQAESGYSFSSLESRNARTAGTSGTALFAGTLEWTLLDEEWSDFLAWWESTSLGVDPFELSCITGASARTHTMQAVQSYNLVRDTGVRKVSLPVKVLDRPSGLSAGWDAALVGPPARYPASYIPMPQCGFKQSEAGLFLATSGLSTAARPVATRGIGLALEWTGLTGYHFDVLVDWWKSTLATGRRKFTVVLPGFEDTLICRLSADPAFTVDGANFSASMELVATPYQFVPLPALGYIYDTWETTVEDRLTDAFSDETADTLYDWAGA